MELSGTPDFAVFAIYDRHHSRQITGPEPFGLVAIALFVQGLGNLFAEGGLGSALIQSQDISDHDIRSVFSTQILIGMVMSSAIASDGSTVSRLFSTNPTQPPSS